MTAIYLLTGLLKSWGTDPQTEEMLWQYTERRIWQRYLIGDSVPSRDRYTTAIKMLDALPVRFLPKPLRQLDSQPALISHTNGCHLADTSIQ